MKNTFIVLIAHMMFSYGCYQLPEDFKIATDKSDQNERIRHLSYRNVKYHFRLSAPNGHWQFYKPTGPNIVAALKTWNGASCNVLIHDYVDRWPFTGYKDITEFQTLDDLTSHLNKANRYSLREYKILSSQQTKLQNVPAYEVKYQENIEHRGIAVPLRAVTYSMYYNTLFYQLTCTCQAKSTQSTFHDIDDIIDSFVIEQQ